MRVETHINVTKVLQIKIVSIAVFNHSEVSTTMRISLLILLLALCFLAGVFGQIGDKMGGLDKKKDENMDARKASRKARMLASKTPKTTSTIASTISEDDKEEHAHTEKNDDHKENHANHETA